MSLSPFESSISLLDVLRGLFRHRKKAIAVFLLTMMCVVGVVLILPKSFTSEAKLYFKLGPEADGNAATATTRGINFDDPREGMINSAKEILSSRALAARVVDEIGAEKILKGPQIEKDQTGGTWLASVYSALEPMKGAVKNLIAKSELSMTEQAIERLRENVGISTEKKSYLVTIYVEAATPELAQQICQSLVDNYREHHIAINAETGSVAALEQNLDKTKTQLTDNRRRLQDLQNEVGPAADIQRTIAQGRKKEKTSELKRILSLNSDLEQQGRWSSNLPETAQFAEIEEGNIAPTLRPRFRAAMLAYTEAVSVLEFFRGHELKTAELRDANDRLKERVGDLEKRLRAAHFEQELGKELVSSVKIAEAPTLTEKPVGPKASVVFVLGFMMSVIGSLGIVFMCELFDSTLRTTEDVESSLHLPVLVSIPRKSPRSFVVS